MSSRKYLWVSIFLIGLLVSIACSAGDLSAAADMGDLDALMPLPELPSLNVKEIKGSGKLAQESRILRDIREVDLSGIGNLHIELGEDEGLRIEAEDNLVQYFKLDINKDKLRIGLQSGVRLAPTLPVDYYLTVKDLKAITLSGSGSIEVNSWTGRNVEMTLAGSGDIQVKDLSVQSAKVKIPGSGNITVSGVVQEQDITIGGSGSYLAAALESGKARAKIEGSGSVEVRTLDVLNVSISGSGSVRYTGNPDIRENISGAGQLVKLEG